MNMQIHLITPMNELIPELLPNKTFELHISLHSLPSFLSDLC